MKNVAFTVLILFAGAAPLSAQTLEQWRFMRTITPEGYVCRRTAAAPVMDGRLDDPAWKSAPWTKSFVDIEGARKPLPRFQTRVKMLWDDRFFYFAAEMEEPHVWGTILFHDQVVCVENDFEIFIDPNADSHEYYEIELSPTNVVWDLFLRMPYKDGGGGLASADHTWDVKGLVNAVWVNGTLNDPRDTDHGWSLEVAVPWSELAPFAHKPSPPRVGDRWRVNFSRVEWEHEVVTSDRTDPDIRDNAYRVKPNTRCDNWVWSPQGVVNMHCPEMFGYVMFAGGNGETAPFRSDRTLEARRVLHDVYYAQRDFREKNGRWAKSLSELGLDFSGNAEIGGNPVIEIRGDGYSVRVEAILPGGGKRIVRIRQDALVEEEAPPGR